LKNPVKIFEVVVSLLITSGFVYLFYRVIGFSKLLQFFAEISISGFIFAFILYVLSYITRTFRWILVLNIKSFFKLFKITVYNTVFNIFLPFRTGEASFFYMMKKENVPFSQSIIPFLTVRVFDAFSLLILFVFSLLLYKEYTYFAVSVIFIFPFVIHVFFKITKYIKIEKLKSFSENSLNLKNVLKLYVLSIFTLLFKFTAFYFVLPENMKLNISQLYFASSAGDLTTVLPIHGLAGIGTYEGGFAGILLLMGIDKETAILSSVFVHIFILFSSFLLAVFSYIFLKK